MFLVLSIYQWIKSWKSNRYEKMHYFTEFFAGIKGDRQARSYALSFISRRVLLCTLVLVYETHHGLFGKTLVFCCIQF